ncbi:MAG: hypothetical protein ABH967_00370 [Patescibacteria group bacterium]
MKIDAKGLFAFMGISVIVLFFLFGWDKTVMLFTLGVLIAGYYSYLEMS